MSAEEGAVGGAGQILSDSEGSPGLLGPGAGLSAGLKVKRKVDFAGTCECSIWYCCFKFCFEVPQKFRGLKKCHLTVQWHWGEQVMTF